MSQADQHKHVESAVLSCRPSATSTCLQPHCSGRPPIPWPRERKSATMRSNRNHLCLSPQNNGPLTSVELRGERREAEKEPGGLWSIGVLGRAFVPGKPLDPTSHTLSEDPSLQRTGAPMPASRWTLATHQELETSRSQQFKTAPPPPPPPPQQG